MKKEYNQYGDLIFSSEQEKQLNQFKIINERGWDYQTSDPQDEVQKQDFINSYILYFKQKHDKKIQNEAIERNNNFLQGIIKKIINKGK